MPGNGYFNEITSEFISRYADYLAEDKGEKREMGGTLFIATLEV